MEKMCEEISCETPKITFDLRFNKFGHVDNLDFSDFEQCAETAAMLHLFNNGTHHWRAANGLPQEDCVNELKKRMKNQKVSPALSKDIGAKFLNAQGRGCDWGIQNEFVPGQSKDAPMYVCGCCGFRSQMTGNDQTSVNYSYKNVFDLEILKMSPEDQLLLKQKMLDKRFCVDIFIDEEGRKKEVDVWKLYSFWP